MKNNRLLEKALEYGRENKVEPGRCIETADGPNGLHVAVSGSKEFPTILTRPKGVTRTCAMPKAIAKSGLPAEISSGGVFIRTSGVGYAPNCKGCIQIIAANPGLRVGPSFRPVTLLERLGSKPIYIIPSQDNGSNEERDTNED